MEPSPSVDDCRAIELLLGGDVMTGRGIDQLLPQPGSPSLLPPGPPDARAYVEATEWLNGPVPRPVSYEYLWGDALPALRALRPDLRIVNLETAITTSDDAWPAKRPRYRMNPPNLACLTAAGLDCCCLANNHTLDWGYAGLAETLQTLEAAGIAAVGAGANAGEAAAPAIFDLPGRGRVVVFGYVDRDTGTPRAWAATWDRAGVNLLDDLSERSARRVADDVMAARQPGDVVVVSIHWGRNWSDRVPDDQARFAHWLIEAGVDVVHGHSSHHPRPIEIFQDRLILYGCGDLLNDYEGVFSRVPRYVRLRYDLRLLYLARLEPKRGRLLELRLLPFHPIRFRLYRAAEADVRWLRGQLSQDGARLGAELTFEPDCSLRLRRT
jgi:poly-gamma-glutamate synthesis protein (capsule biosynthesis protein)